MKCAFAVLVAVFLIGISVTDAARKPKVSEDEDYLPSDLYESETEDFIEDGKVEVEEMRQTASDIYDTAARYGMKTGKKTAKQLEKFGSRGRFAPVPIPALDDLNLF